MASVSLQPNQGLNNLSTPTINTNIDLPTVIAKVALVIIAALQLIISLVGIGLVMVKTFGILPTIGIFLAINVLALAIFYIYKRRQRLPLVVVTASAAATVTAPIQSTHVVPTQVVTTQINAPVSKPLAVEVVAPNVQTAVLETVSIPPIIENTIPKSSGLVWDKQDPFLLNTEKEIEEQRKYLVATPDAKRAIELMTQYAATAHPVLDVEQQIHSDTGKRLSNEDGEFFVKKANRFVLFGIFDGHGGNYVSSFAAKQLPDKLVNVIDTEILPRSLIGERAAKIAALFQKGTNAIHDKCIKKSKSGATELLVYIDLETGELLSGALADTELRVIRIVDGKQVLIPLSIKKDWSDPEEFQRIKDYYGSSLPSTYTDGTMHPKAIRFPLGVGVNTSRAMGDPDCQPAVIHELLFAKGSVQPGDFLIAACDGFWDLLNDLILEKIFDYRIGKIVEVLVKDPEKMKQIREDRYKQLIECIEATLKEKGDVSKALVRLAIDKWESTDNVTVIFMLVK